MNDYLISPNNQPDTARFLLKSVAQPHRLVHQRSRFGLIRIATLLCVLSFATLISAQSTVVSIDRDAEVPLNGQSLTVDRVPSDLSPTIKAVERRLANKTPETWRSEMPMERLMYFMNRAGFRVYLTESARENNLDEETVMRMALHNASIEENLRFILYSCQCDYTILDSGTIMIASEDYLIENPVTVTFDITNLPLDPDQVIVGIEESIDPDGWEANGGTGRIAIVASNDRKLIVVTSKYSILRQIRRQLGTFSAMTGARGLPATQKLLAGASTPVLLPGASEDSGRRNRGGRGGGIGGGAGLGGGVF